METAPKILIVIPCLNEEAHLPKLLEGLLSSRDAQTMRIVVVDGGSRDRTPALAKDLAERHPNLFLLHNQRRIQSAAVNLAVAKHGQDAAFLIRIDAHADYPAAYCRRLIDEALATKSDSVVVAVHTVGKTLFQKAVAVAQNSKLGNGGSAHRGIGDKGRWVDHGHHALMRITAFRAVGGYDENFSHNEDAELDRRLTQAGYKIWLTGRTAMTYYPRASAQALFRQYIGYGFGRAHTIIKHKMRPKARQMLPAFVVPALLVALFAPWWGWAIMPLALWVVLCIAYGIALAYREKEASIAMAGPAAMLMHAGWSFGFWRAMPDALWKRS